MHKNFVLTIFFCKYKNKNKNLKTKKEKIYLGPVWIKLIYELMKIAYANK
jgi:hypothetical protein